MDLELIKKLNYFNIYANLGFQFDGIDKFENYGKDLELLKYLDKANEKGIKFALSNVIEHNGIVNNVLLEWSKKYKVFEIDSDYSNCSYHKKNKTLRTREVLIVNY